MKKIIRDKFNYNKTNNIDCNNVFNNNELYLLQHEIINIENDNSFTKEQIKNIQTEIFNKMNTLLKQKIDEITKLQNIIENNGFNRDYNKQIVLLENIIEQQNKDIVELNEIIETQKTKDNEINGIFLNFIKVLEKRDNEFFKLQNNFELYKQNPSNNFNIIPNDNIITELHEPTLPQNIISTNNTHFIKNEVNSLRNTSNKLNLNFINYNNKSS